MRISETAEQHGFGSSRWKWVSRLSDEERKATRRGEAVYFKSTRLSGGRWGVYWRRAEWNGKAYIPRTVTAIELKDLEKSVE